MCYSTHCVSSPPPPAPPPPQNIITRFNSSSQIHRWYSMDLLLFYSEERRRSICEVSAAVRLKRPSLTILTTGRQIVVWFCRIFEISERRRPSETNWPCVDTFIDWFAYGRWFFTTTTVTDDNRRGIKRFNPTFYQVTISWITRDLVIPESPDRYENCIVASPDSRGMTVTIGLSSLRQNVHC